MAPFQLHINWGFIFHYDTLYRLIFTRVHLPIDSLVITMAGRLIFAIAAVAVLSTCCRSTVEASHTKEELKEAKQRHWDHTVTKMVNVTSKVADKVETVLNRTADTVFIAANVIGGAASDLTARLSEKLGEASNKWTELKNRSAQKMANTRANLKEAKDKIHDKLAVGVGKLIEKGNQLINFAVGVAGQVVGKVVGTAQQVKSKVEEHKSDSNGKMFFVALPSKSSPLSNRIVSSSTLVPVVVRQDNTTTATQSSASQSIYYF